MKKHNLPIIVGYAYANNQQLIDSMIIHGSIVIVSENRTKFLKLSDI